MQFIVRETTPIFLSLLLSLSPDYQPFLLLALRRWFPDWDERVAEQGGFIVPWDVNFHASGFRLSSPTAVYPHPDPSILPPHPNIPRERLPESFCLSRAKFEPLLRKLVVEHRKNIRIVNGLVTGFLRKGDTKNLTDVTYTTGSADTTEQSATLVVDCSGPAMAGLKALRRLVNSAEAFQTSSYSPKIRYATVTFKVKEEIKDRLPIPGGYNNAGWFYTHMSIGTIDRSIFFGARIEDDQSRFIFLRCVRFPTLTPLPVQIGFGGWGYTPNQIPHSADELIAFHESLEQADGRPSPIWFTEVIKLLCADGGWENSIYEECAMRMSPLHFPCPMQAHIIWHLVANVTQVLYAKSESVPPNFVAIGDSVLQSNPAYGFGATKACVGAVTLAGLLAKIRSTEIPAPFALLFFRKQHMRTGWTWEGAKVADYVFDSTEPCEGEKKDRSALATKTMVSWFRVCEKVGQLLYTRGNPF